ncbi:MAG: hypothetical protein LAT82_04855 [Nanoarchaeota archaeon]|nr:hypothetical protein [Nanoarchaeota archaeon]
MSIFSKNNPKSNNSAIIEYLYSKLSSKSSIRDLVKENNSIVTQIGTYSFEFYHNILEVEFYFHFEKYKDELLIINDHRYSQFQGKENASKYLEEIEIIFQEVAKKLNYTKIVIIFEIKDITNSTAVLVEKFLSKNKFQKTQNNSPQKWIKIYNIS